MPSWQIPLLLGIVVLTLVALLIGPSVLGERNSTLRRELAETLTPAQQEVSRLDRAMGLEAAAIRGYALLGHEGFRRRFLTAHEEAERSASALAQQAPQLNGAVEEAVRETVRRRAEWVSHALSVAEGRIDAETNRAMLPLQQQRYEAAIAATARLDALLTQRVQAQRARIETAERHRETLTWILVALALLAAAATGYLSFRLHRSGRYLLARAQEEAALSAVARLLNEAQDLDQALHQVAQSACEIVQADGTHLEQVDAERKEIVVAAAAGSGNPPERIRAAYPGSLAEQVLSSGTPEFTTTAEMVRQRRPMAPFISAACPSCHLLVVPLISEGVPMGALMLNRAETKPGFSAAEAERIELLAQMAAFVLRRLSLFEQTRASEQALRQAQEHLERMNEGLEEQVRERTTQVRTLASELALAEQRERRAVAQILHDDLQQHLYGLQLMLTMAQARARSTPDTVLTSRLETTSTLVRQAIDTARHLTIDLSPIVLEGEGLEEALRWLAIHMEERFGLHVALKREGSLTVPEDDMRVLLFQTVREILFSIATNGRSDRAVVTLEEREEHLHIAIRDKQGRTRPDDLTEERPSGAGGMNLRQARDRLGLFGGHLDVSTTAIGETRVSITLPTYRLRS